MNGSGRLLLNNLRQLFVISFNFSEKFISVFFYNVTLKSTLIMKI